MHYWTNEIWRLSYLVIGFGLLGLLIGAGGWGVALGLAVHMTFTLWHLKKLYGWLEAPVMQKPPSGDGVWGDLFDRLYRYQKSQAQLQGRLRRVLTRVEESSEAMQDGIVMLDRAGHLDWWNSAAERMLGLDARHDRGHHITNYLRDPAFIQYFNQADYSEPVFLSSPAHDGRTIEARITVFGDNERLVLARDVTRLQRLEQTRRDFVANVSHELRTPLTVVSGYLETFLDQADQQESPVPPRLKRAFGQMQSQTRRMQSLVDDLLTLSRLETSERQTERQPVDIAALCREIHTDAASLSNGRHQFTLSLDEHRTILGDANELRSALSNLVINAVRYTPDGTTITLRYLDHPRGAMVEVIDDGDGIPKTHLSRLTERFYRVDKSRSTQSGGTGLGLAIVKHVLLRHDARLEIESDVGQGATFRCVFPASRLAAGSSRLT
ncbi:phosphate regulon sensor histidine kinase PhoR [Larsenimonas suaedae]|uniref:Phosphate regulon sensor protein PhoR n=1 Tax=Larsenimonas suaedae TaxID=1851019 RepID=A0ABU1GXT8_9GAMM|nr:phosphate regulon sensor histidine kinase PhoR [Larsenimonas suaedae]MCM2973250.1 phosphate regulon sensor histidine kinase PhoR [Larsenimonas suaedae]MDR5896143.1 phosphate regulon sensor histidine kinase PhoR [Larsenimonas suaedae]